MSTPAKIYAVEGKILDALKEVSELPFEREIYKRLDALLESQAGKEVKAYMEVLAYVTAYRDVQLDTPKRHYVNVYEVTRHYGGPEEGGWYYNAGMPLAAIPYDTLRHAISHDQEALRNMFRDKEEGDIYSVLGGTEVHITIEEHPPEQYPETGPTYE